MALLAQRVYTFLRASALCAVRSCAHFLLFTWTWHVTLTIFRESAVFLMLMLFEGINNFLKSKLGLKNLKFSLITSDITHIFLMFMAVSFLRELLRLSCSSLLLILHPGAFGKWQKEVARVRSIWVCCGWASAALLWLKWPSSLEASCRSLCFTQHTVYRWLKPGPCSGLPWLQVPLWSTSGSVILASLTASGTLASTSLCCCS